MRKRFIIKFYEYFNDKLFPSECGFREGFSSQQNFLVMREKLKKSIDKENTF